MKRILCFGDSNTYGYNPKNGSRFDFKTRWTGILKEQLSDEYEVIECGCNNRTCFSDCIDGIEQTGYKILPYYMNKDIDILILALGINDLQKIYSVSVNDMEKGIENLVLAAKNINSNVKIIIAAPSRLNKNVLKGAFRHQFDENSIAKSAFIADIYEKIAVKYNSKFIDLSKIAPVSNIDGLHYDEIEHKKIAQAFETLINLT